MCFIVFKNINFNKQDTTGFLGRLRDNPNRANADPSVVLEPADLPFSRILRYSNKISYSVGCVPTIFWYSIGIHSIASRLFSNGSETIAIKL